jgi:hypothetical protein
MKGNCLWKNKKEWTFHERRNFVGDTVQNLLTIFALCDRMSIDISRLVLWYVIHFT